MQSTLPFPHHIGHRFANWESQPNHLVRTCSSSLNPCHPTATNRSSSTLSHPICMSCRTLQSYAGLGPCAHSRHYASLPQLYTNDLWDITPSRCIAIGTTGWQCLPHLCTL